MRFVSNTRGGRTEQDLIREKTVIDAMVNEFSQRMKDRLGERLAEGYQGWDNLDLLSFADMSQEAIRCIRNAYGIQGPEQLVDAADWIIFMWNRTHD